jgi:hypothetical protein
MTQTTTTPTAEQIATIDPLVDMETADAAGITMAHRAAHILTVACDEPRCPGRTGDDCRSPNGWMVRYGFHASRVDKAYGRTKPAKTRAHRLTDPQAEWLEHAAESDAHRLYAPGQYGHLRGDAARRAKADAMERAGLIHQVATGSDGAERVFELTDTGWAAYWSHRLVIRRGTPPNHPATCPCKTTEPK